MAMDSGTDGIPFQESDEFIRTRLLPSSIPGISWDHYDYIPGEPAIKLTKTEDFLRKELATPVLDELFHKLWLAGKKSGSNIDALHKQIIKGREIVLTEDSTLHLVCQESRIFIKPAPLCLFRYDFWTLFLDKEPLKSSVLPLYHTEHSYRDVALGFMRSYAFLIQHRSDLELARQHHLISDMGVISWSSWSKFIAGFRNVTDEQVAKRYRYGQLHLTRLNWVAHLFHMRSGEFSWLYEESSWTTMPYLREVIIPLAFLFASVSIILSAMQVLLAVPNDSLLSVAVDPGTVQRASWRFSMSMLVLSTVSLFLLGVVPLVLIVSQLSWSNRHTEKKTT